MGNAAGAKAEGSRIRLIAGLPLERDQSMVRPSSRGGVPCLSRHPEGPSFSERLTQQNGGGLSRRAPGYCCSPQ